MPRFKDLDTFDQKIVRELGRDGRVSWRDLAKRIGLSLSPTLRRVKHLEQSGVIKGYRAEFDEGRFQGGIGVFVSVALEHQVKAMLSDFEDSVSSLPEVVGGYQVSGSFDYLIHAMVRDLEHYQRLLERLTETQGVSRIETKFVVKSFVRRSEGPHAFPHDGSDPAESDGAIAFPDAAGPDHSPSR